MKHLIDTLAANKLDEVAVDYVSEDQNFSFSAEVECRYTLGLKDQVWDKELDRCLDSLRYHLGCDTFTLPVRHQDAG